MSFCVSSKPRHGLGVHSHRAGLEAILKQLLSKGFLFRSLSNSRRAGAPLSFGSAGVRRASRLGFACIPIATGGQNARKLRACPNAKRWRTSATVAERCIACARNANRVTLPLEYYEAARDKKLIDFQAAAANIQAA
jgi:hypothetical protein